VASQGQSRLSPPTDWLLDASLGVHDGSELERGSVDVRRRATQNAGMGGLDVRCSADLGGSRVLWPDTNAAVAKLCVLQTSLDVTVSGRRGG
jgi:hypothetical protein